MRDRAWRDLGKDPNLLNFDDTVTIPDEYLASVAKASKKVASRTAVPPPPEPPPLQQSTQPSSHAIAAPIQPSGGPSEYRGVSWSQRDRVFRAQVGHNMKALYVGQSTDAKEAAFMRDRVWRDLGKDPNLLNFDDTVTIPDEYLASVAKTSKTVRRAWADIDDDAVVVEDNRDLHTKAFARRLLDLLVEDLEVELSSDSDVAVSSNSTLPLGDQRDHHAERHCAYRAGHVHVLVTTQRTCLACEQWLVAIAQQLQCAFVVVSGALFDGKW